ncbi:type II toxin-antitoxin system VapC family toxin [Promineifilum sp.]|uniref:type II toxin-antitoxin system VapC family toxin n=1 Tax=Promineifilum sp. TaxID=2664178 RepID=UPI0035B0DACC
MLVDSNILIYAFLGGNRSLQRFVVQRLPAVSAITYVEVLGYHRLSGRQKAVIEQLFDDLSVLPLDRPVLAQAVKLRQQRHIGLGDALIAATALVHHRTLVTRNTADFAWIPDLYLLDPFAETE